MARLLLAVATCRLAERRVLSFRTLLSECLPAGQREGLPPDTVLHDLLLNHRPVADLLLGRCLEAVTGEPLAEVVRHEVVDPAGLRATSWSPEALSTPEDLDRLLALLGPGGDGALLQAQSRRLLLDRGYALTRLGGGALAGYGATGTGAAGPVAAHHHPELGLTVVACGRPAALAGAGAARAEMVHDAR